MKQNGGSSSLSMRPRLLWFLMMAYAMVLVCANWFDARLVSIFGLVTDAGTLVFPLSFLLSDIITEVYGYKHARRAIWAGFFFNVFFIVYGQLVAHLPSPEFALKNNQMFNQLLAINVRIIAASIFSYIIAEPLNAYIIAKLKVLTDGRLIWLRFVLSTFFASGADSFVFGTAAFLGTMSHYNLLLLIVVMWFLKVCIECVGLPFSIWLARKVKQIEELDIYDTKTNFTLFSFDGGYQNTANHFKEFDEKARDDS